MKIDRQFARSDAARGRLRPTAYLVAIGTAVLAIAALGVVSYSDPLDDGVALGGHDPVAYFVDGVARHGIHAHEAKVGGKRYLFVSEENRAIFVESPSEFLPQFSGLDAYGLRLGERRPGDPTQFRVLDGRLFLLGDAASVTAWDRDHIHNTRVAELIFRRLSALAPQ